MDQPFAPWRYFKASAANLEVVDDCLIYGINVELI